MHPFARFAQFRLLCIHYPLCVVIPPGTRFVRQWAGNKPLAFISREARPVRPRVVHAGSRLERRWFRIAVGRGAVLRMYEPSLIAAIVQAGRFGSAPRFVAFGHGVTEPGRGYHVPHAEG